MRWNSIRTKVLVTLLGCLILGTCGVLALMQYSFEHNAQDLAQQSVTEAQKLFSILEAREVSKMTAVSDTLLQNRQVLDAFADGDRGRLLDVTQPLYASLKNQGITNWMFHTREPQMSVFLRLHNPEKYGDTLHRFIDKEVVRTHSLVTGNELAKAGFAVRVLRPVYDSHRAVAGYVEFGEELGHFIHTMKGETGNDYGLLLSKGYVDRQFWADSNKTWNRRDNWDDNPSFVLADKTTDSDNIIRFDGDLGVVPDNGQVLERIQDGNTVFVRGLFPIRDASGHIVGAMFVVHDISSLYLAMRHMQMVMVLVIVVALSIGTFLVLTLLRKLVFRRLENIIAVATRVVGGDYETEIHISADDEVGQFERLFEQFRLVFLDVLQHVPELQENQTCEAKGKSAGV